MVSEPVSERLIEAGAYLDQAEKMGDNPQALGPLIACDGILENIKVFVHEDEPWEQIHTKEKDLNKIFWENFKKESEKLKDEGEYFKFLKQQKVEVHLMFWKCKQRLGFYDWLTQKYDI